MNNRGGDANPTMQRRDNRSGDSRNKDRGPVGNNRGGTSNTLRNELRLGSDIPNKSQGTRQAEQTKQKPTFTELYGTINTIKQGFGFIQPIIDEEQIYFGGRELQPDMKVGDRVGFILRESVRGLAAENVRLLSQQMDKVVANVKGNVTRNPDRHRSSFGMAGLELSTTDPRSAAMLESAGLKEVAFSPSDVLSESIPKGHRLDKGDYLEFSVHRFIGSNFYVAKNVTMLQLKRERVIAQQIQRMLDAGVEREYGIVSALKKGEYGFIKPLDRKDEIYFRLEEGPAAKGEDAADVEAERNSKLVEGSEVQFFVITECVKGKMSDRAIHVRSVPKGTVKFELVLASAVRAVVIAESGSRPEESPGIARLDAPVSVAGPSEGNGDSAFAAAAAALAKKSGGSAGATAAAAVTSSIKTIELWQRCLPDELVCKVGDVLELDVHYYRPEKLFFARAVKVVQFRRVGRERGTVCSLKDNGFGFIQSSVRNADAYFKSSHVLSWESQPLPEGALKIGSTVSYDVICEDTNSGGKLRAKRVMLESPASVQARATADAERYLLKPDVTGVVVRNSTKKDSPGLIRLLSPAVLDEIQVGDFSDPEMMAALTEFQTNTDLQSVMLYALPLATLRAYSKLIESKFPGIAHEACPADLHDTALGHNMKLFKLEQDKYEAWKSSPRKASANERNTKLTGGSAEQSTVQFSKDDYITPEFGALSNDLKVTFNLCWEPSRGKIVAKQIRLVDEAVLDGNGQEVGEVQGVVDVLVDKGEKYGFIRCIPSDEKLFWHMTSAPNAPTSQQGRQGNGNGNAPPLMLGSEVTFQLRRRGGLRCAANIRPLSAGALSAEMVLPEACIALLTGPAQAVLVDVSQAAQLNRKYLDNRVVLEVFASKTDNISLNSGNIGVGGWNKLTLGGENSSPVPFPPDMSSLSLGGSPVPPEGLASEGSSPSRPALSSPLLIGQDEAAVSTVSIDDTDFKAKYFPVLPRLSVPVLAGTAAASQVGDLVSCQASVNWPLQRSPVHVAVSAPSVGKALKKKGRISRLKFRVPAPTSSEHVSAESLQCYSIGTIDFVELSDSNFEDSSHSVDALGQFFYCQVQELVPTDEHSRELPQVGDEVEFWVVPPVGRIAFGARLLPKLSARDHGIQFSKRPTAVQADTGKPKISPLNLITMAEGPPSDASTGFPAGWRTEAEANRAITDLPWAFLFQ